MLEVILNYLCTRYALFCAYVEFELFIKKKVVAFMILLQSNELH
jgi:hypothetical protein